MSVLSGLGAGLNPGTSAGTSTSGTQIVPGMMGVYNNALARNQGYYNDVQSAYGTGQSRLQATLPGIYQGYNNVLGNVQNTLGFGGTSWGVAAPAAEAIGRTLAATQGQTQQDLINRGLGNSSVLGNLANQNAYNAAQAYAGLGSQLAQTYAGYQSQLGLAGLQAQFQGLGMQNQLTQSQAQTDASFKEALPNLLGSYGTSTQASNQGYRGGAGSMYGNPNGGTGGGFLNDNSDPYGSVMYGQGTGAAATNTNNYNPFTAPQPNYFSGSAGYPGSPGATSVGQTNISTLPPTYGSVGGFGGSAGGTGSSGFTNPAYATYDQTLAGMAGMGPPSE